MKSVYLKELQFINFKSQSMMNTYLLVTMHKFIFSIQRSFKFPLNTDYLYVDGACKRFSKNPSTVMKIKNLISS